MREACKGGRGMFATVLYKIGYVWAADIFCKKFLGAFAIREALFALSLFSSQVLAGIVDRQYPALHIFLVFGGHLMFLGLALLLFGGSKGEKALAVSLFLAAVTLAENFCMSFFSCLALAWLHTWRGILSPVLDGWGTNLMCGASLAIGILAAFWAAGRALPAFHGKAGRYHAVVAVPLFAAVGVMDVANWGAANGILVRSGGNLGPYYDQLFGHAEIGILAAMSMFGAGFYVFGMGRICLEQEKASRYASQVAAYKMLEEQRSQSERLRHDMKNHVIALQSLLEQEEWQKMGGYLEDMAESAGFGDNGELTGDRVVDALLSQKRNLAEARGIAWECDVQIPRQCGLNEFDVCVLFGNLLDNAVEACGRLQEQEGHGDAGCFIHIQANAVKKCFLLEIKNSACMGEGFKVGRSAKGNPGRHGIGLLNVRDVVGKYHGAMELESQDGMFTVSILLPFQDHT